jgi:EXLDI family protein
MAVGKYNRRCCTVNLRKRFIGRVLVKGHVGGAGSPRHEWITIYQTVKGKFVVHTKSYPGWWYKQNHRGNWGKVDWSDRWEYRLNIYDSLDELSNDVPEELFEAAFAVIEDGPIEDLDI